MREDGNCRSTSVLSTREDVRLGAYSDPVTVPSSWGKTPRERIEQECARRGKDAVVAGCMELLGGRDADAELILALGGPPARWVVTGEPPRAALLVASVGDARTALGLGRRGA